MKTENEKMDMPYEKFMRFGAENLTESELLAIIIRTGTKDESALEIAKKVLALAKYPRCGLLGLFDVSVKDLTAIKGIGLVKAVKLKCITELSRRIANSRSARGVCFHDARSVAEYFMERLRHNETESVFLICLDGKAQMISEKRISDGSVRMSLVSPREIFLEALRSHAVNMILVHNHPSGDPTPSSADRKITLDLIRLGEMMNIPLLDHIIIGDNRYTSFRELFSNDKL